MILLCCYSFIIKKRKHRKHQSRSNYFKNIKSVYAVTGDIDHQVMDENEISTDIVTSQIPLHLMKDVLLQGDDISNFEESTVNDDELQVYYQEGSDCFSN